MTQIELPETVSGRRISNRGVHLQPFGHHRDWLNRASYWVELLQSMHMSWVVLLTDGDAVRQEHYGLNPLRVLLDGGIIPIIREQKQFPYPFTEHDTFRWTVDLYGEYGLKPFWIIRNEPFDGREWAKNWSDKHTREEQWERIMTVWANAANFIASNGGIVGFPDGPCYDFNPFDSIKAYDCQWIFDEGKGFYAGHHYGKGRPPDYPYDHVTRYGTQLTEHEYRLLLDDYADDPAWHDLPLDWINEARTRLANPTLTALEDDTCWRGWEKVAHWSNQSFGYVVPMAMTEGGWVPRDRAGSGPDTDVRWPHTTPRQVAVKTLQMFESSSPFFAICPWLVACGGMGGVGWEDDAWVGGSFMDRYGYEKPVVQVLQDNPPGELEPEPTPEPIPLPEPEPEPAPPTDNWALLLEKLARIEELVGRLPVTAERHGHGEREGE